MSAKKVSGASGAGVRSSVLDRLLSMAAQRESTTFVRVFQGERQAILTLPFAVKTLDADSIATQAMLSKATLSLPGGGEFVGEASLKRRQKTYEGASAYEAARLFLLEKDESR